MMKEVGRSVSGRFDMAMIEALHEQFEQVSFGCGSSSFSIDGFSSEALSMSFGPSEHGHIDDASSSTGGSSPLALFPQRYDQILPNSLKPPHENAASVWSEKCDKELSELEMMKEKFAKLLLGEDMSGGGKGVSSALAISNAITNLSASVFGEIWRLEPLSMKRKAMWRREMDWLVSIADHIVELVPSLQTFPDGSSFEIMISRPRTDLQLNLPALRKLDAMLLECLDSFSEAEFWYVDQGVSDNDFDNSAPRHSLLRNAEKWWLPTVKVPVSGLSDGEKKRLQHQRDCINQILKAALAINSQVLSEMEIPDVYWKALPKNGKASLGETIYKSFTSDSFSPEAFLSACDLSSEHKTLELANRIEAVIHVWRRGRQPKSRSRLNKDSWKNGKSSWGMVKEFVSDAERREFLAERAEEVLLCLKQKFPGLRQSLLDMTKIQCNKDVGQSILESYSRVMESLASSILARIDDIIFAEEMNKCSVPLPLPPNQYGTAPAQKRAYSSFSTNQSPFRTPFKTPNVSPVPSPSQRRTPNSPLDSEQSQVLSDYISFSYEVDCTNNSYGSHDSKKLPTGQQTKGALSSRSVNSIRSQSVHPVQDE
ncbi:hypothetical protein GOP47_0007115 [Adiantum capillus-veneris]|uniref:PRONE domain-containing protein n=1 Tax=Adiantum capillus-veneris TaxID=13818 RepID=A0A9D4ZL77_ADICA|nr:hypothetical protein GOP47_0007115 [Adiantum capillus-veneris]